MPADVHTHFLPPRMQRRVWAHFDEAGPLIGRPWPITYRGDEREQVETLRGKGVAMFSALAYAHRPGMAADLNDWTLDFAARTPGCLPSATFYPEAGAEAYAKQAMAPFPRELKPRLRDLGLAGKVLLGSDFPNIPYPYEHQIDSLVRLDLGDEWLNAVCWGNAQALFAPRG